MAFCPQCGTGVADDASFCPACGRDLAAARSAITDPPPPPPPPQPERKPEAADEPATERERRPAAAEPETDPEPGEESEGGGVAAGAALLGRLPGSWALPVRLAAAALGIGIAMQYGAGVVMSLIQVAAGAAVDWGATLRAPLSIFLAFHGPVEGLGLWATGLIWIGSSFWWAARRVLPESEPLPVDVPGDLFRLTLKTAAAYIVPVAVVAWLLPGEALPMDTGIGVAGSVADPASYAGWTAYLILSLGFLASIIGLMAVWRVRSGRPVAGLLGLPASAFPRWLSPAWAGARIALGIALTGTAVLVAAGVLVDVLGSGLGAGLLVAYLLTVLLVLAWSLVDVATVFMVFSMRLFIGDGVVVGGGRPGWVYAAVGITGLAFLAGGMEAARRSAAKSPAGALLAGASVGPLVGLTVFALTWFTAGSGAAVSGAGLALPFLWSAVAGAGGLLGFLRSGPGAGSSRSSDAGSASGRR